jgi:hypothetical protein
LFWEDAKQITVIEQIVEQDKEDREAKAAECYNDHQQDGERSEEWNLVCILDVRYCQKGKNNN